MSVTLQYKGWSFEFDSLPSSDEIRARYQTFIECSEIVMPVPTPVPLERDSGPYREDELGGLRFLLFFAGDDQRKAALEAVIESAGGTTSNSDVNGDETWNGMICDVSSASSREDLDALFVFVQKHLQRLKRCAHIVVLTGQVEDAATAEQASIWEATDGFVRTLAKELGPTGGTINRFVLPRTQVDLAGPLTFFLSSRSAYVTGQTLHIRPSEAAASSPDSSILKGKVALVTGGARGIGRATAIQLAREGATVIALDLPADNDFGEEGSEALLEQLRAKHGIIPLLADIAKPSTVDEILKVVEPLGGLDILVNNAAIVRDGMSFMLPRSSWDAVLDVNLDGLRRVTDELLDRETIREGGRLIFVGSVAGIAGNVGQLNYTTCKAGVRGLARFYAGRGSRGVTSNAVIVGPTNTRLLKALPAWIMVIGHRLNALGQAGVPEDPANLITFIASDRANSINGEFVRCCGNALQGA